MREGSYWTSDTEVLDYYAEDMDDCVILVICMRDLDEASCAPDMPGIEEPITTALGKSENEILSEWDASKKTWQDSLSIIGSMRYERPISTDIIIVDDGGEEILLDDYIFSSGDANNCHFG
jgi:hypothetical protein